MNVQHKNQDTHIRFDWVCKRLFRSKADFGILEGFLSELLKEDVKIKEILESEGNQRHKTDKFNRVDILAKNQDDELFLIEVQNESEIDFFQRMAYGASRLMLDFLHKGDDYSGIKKIYSINILYFDLGQGQDYVYHGKTSFKGIHQHDLLRLSARQQVLFGAELPENLLPEYYVLKVNNFNDIAKDGLDAWIYYLKNNQVPQDVKAKGMKEVEAQLKIDDMSADEYADYQIFLANRVSERTAIFTAKDEGLAEGEEIGIQKGILKGKLETARNLKQLNLSVEDIAKATGLSAKEIEEL